MLFPILKRELIIEAAISTGIKARRDSSSFGSYGPDDDDSYYYYYSDEIFPSNLITTWQATTGCVAAFLLAAFIAFFMVARTHWLNQTGVREGRRLSAFLFLCVLIVIGRAIYLANIILLLIGPNDYGGYYYYYDVGFTTRPIASYVIRLISTTLLLILVLEEVIKPTGQIDDSRKALRSFNSMAIILLLVIGVVGWAISLRGLSDDEFEGLIAVIALDTTYAALAALIATTLLVGALRIHSGAISQSHAGHIKILTLMLWIGQALYLTSVCSELYNPSDDRVVKSTALFAAYEVTGIFQILFLVWLARDSHYMNQRAVTQHTEAVAGNPSTTHQTEQK